MKQEPKQTAPPYIEEATRDQIVELVQMYVPSETGRAHLITKIEALYNRGKEEEREQIPKDWQFRFDALLKNYSEDRPVPPAVIRAELEALWKALKQSDV